MIGLIGAGNIASAFARGLGQPIFCTDSGSGRAEQLVAELGGEALTSNTELAKRAEFVVLCHKPGQLDQVASQIGSQAKTVISLLAGVTLEQLTAAYPSANIFRFMVNTAMEVGAGVSCYAASPTVPAELEQQVVGLFQELGTVKRLDERLIDTATAVMGVGPAYVALLSEAWVDAAVKHGLDSQTASELVAATFAGTVKLIEAREYDTLAVRRAVTSPGGVTAKGIAALENAGIRAAFVSAVEAVLSRSQNRSSAS